VLSNREHKGALRAISVGRPEHILAAVDHGGVLTLLGNHSVATNIFVEPVNDPAASTADASPNGRRYVLLSATRDVRTELARGGMPEMEAMRQKLARDLLVNMRRGRGYRRILLMTVCGLICMVLGAAVVLGTQPVQMPAMNAMVPGAGMPPMPSGMMAPPAAQPGSAPPSAEAPRAPAANPASAPAFLGDASTPAAPVSLDDDASTMPPAPTPPLQSPAAPVSPDRTPSRFSPASGFRDMYAGGNRVCAFQEKHGRTYYDVSTPDDFAMTFLSVLKDRLEDGYYLEDDDDDDEPMLDGIPDPVAAAYLSTVPAPGFSAPPVGVAALVSAWPKDAAVAILCSPKIPGYMLARRLRDAVHGDESDAVVAYLGQAVLLRAEGYGSFVARLLRDRQPGSLCSRLASSIPKSDRMVAHDILCMAAQSSSNIRRAGRLAYGVLGKRRDGEYEGFDVEDMSRAVLDLSAYVPADPPSP
jgi:hypothetical protein